MRVQVILPPFVALGQLPPMVFPEDFSAQRVFSQLSCDSQRKGRIDVPPFVMVMQDLDVVPVGMLTSILLEEVQEITQCTDCEGLGPLESVATSRSTAQKLQSKTPL